MGWIRSHFRKHRHRPPWGFCWRVGLEGMLVSMLAALALLPVVEDDPAEMFTWPLAAIFIVIVIVAPVLETLLCQALPVAIARRFTRRFAVQVIVALIPFAILHFFNGIASGICAGVIGGFYFAFTYVHWREHARWTAFWVTAVSHALHNGVAFVVLVAERIVAPM